MRLQLALGLRTRVLCAAEVLELAPALAPGEVRGAMYQIDGGFAHHDAAVWGYARAAARLGAGIHPYTEVLAVGQTAAGRVTGSRTSRGSIATPVVVDAAGGMAAGVARLAGVEVPLRTFVLEAMVTEPLKPFLRPALSAPRPPGLLSPDDARRVRRRHGAGAAA